MKLISLFLAMGFFVWSFADSLMTTEVWEQKIGTGLMWLVIYLALKETA